MGRDRVVKVRTPVIVFLPGGQQVGRESTSVPKVAEEPRLPHVLRDVLRHIQRDAVRIANRLDPRHATPRRVEPLSPQIGPLEVGRHPTDEPVPMRRRPCLVGLHLEPSERAGSSRPHRVIPPANELPFRAADAEMGERTTDLLGIPVGERGEDLPLPGVRHPPAEVARPTVQRANGVSSSRVGHALRPFPLVGAASLVKDGGAGCALCRTLCSRAYWCIGPVTKATRTVPCQRLWRLHISGYLLVLCTHGALASAPANSPDGRAELTELRPIDSGFQGLRPFICEQLRAQARALVARGSRPAHTRPRLRRWRPRDTDRNAPLTRGASLQGTRADESDSDLAQARVTYREEPRARWPRRQQRFDVLPAPHDPHEVSPTCEVLDSSDP